MFDHIFSHMYGHKISDLANIESTRPTIICLYVSTTNMFEIRRKMYNHIRPNDDF